jgi:hypothetical protein
MSFISTNIQNKMIQQTKSQKKSTTKIFGISLMLTNNKLEGNVVLYHINMRKIIKIHFFLKKI